MTAQISATCPARCAGPVRDSGEEFTPPEGYDSQCPVCGNGNVDPNFPDIQARLGVLFARQGQRIATLLREAADDVIRHTSAVHLDVNDSKPDHAEAAGMAARDIERLLGNLHLDALVRAACDADRYARSTTEGPTHD